MVNRDRKESNKAAQNMSLSYMDDSIWDDCKRRHRDDEDDDLDKENQ